MQRGEGESPPATHLIRLRSVDSTNAYARRLLGEDHPPEWTVVVAGEQTDGRGQHANRWISTPGENLTCSVVLRPSFMHAADQFRLAKAVCLALADTLDRHGVQARIKWPNDVYVNRRKIAGVLIQNAISGFTVNTAVVGVGLNVNQTKFPDFPVEPTSLQALTSTTHDLDDVLNQFLADFVRRYTRTREDGTSIDRDYLSRLYRYGTWARYRVDGVEFSGRIAGVDEGGWLQVEGNDGEIQTYRFKEIEYVR